MLGKYYSKNEDWIKYCFKTTKESQEKYNEKHSLRKLIESNIGVDLLSKIETFKAYISLSDKCNEIIKFQTLQYLYNLCGNNNKETNNALDLLASNYSGDSDSIDDDDDNDNEDDLKRKQNHNDVVTEVLNEPNNNKKLKSNCDNDETIGYVFPVPRLCNPEIDNSFDGLVLFPKDYISHERTWCGV